MCRPCVIRVVRHTECADYVEFRRSALPQSFRQMTTHQSQFRFLDPGRLVDGNLELVLTRAECRDTRRGVVPQYEFDLRSTGTTLTMGLIKLRILLTDELKLYGGNLSYDVDEAYRGHRYAARGCRLLFPLAKRHGLTSLLITCAPDNAASQRTSELIGAQHVDTIEVEIEPGKHRPTCRFVVSLEPASTPDALGRNGSF
jgi:predicted acetyltransferase